MKILHIIDSLSVGGAEKLVRETIPVLVKNGYTVDVVLLNGIQSHLYRELEALECCKIYSLGKSFYNPFYIVKLVPFFYRYDIVHVHLFPAQYFAALARLFCFRRVKLLFTEHNTSNTRLENRKYRWIEKMIYACYDKVICITNEVKEVLVDKLNFSLAKLVVLENGINIEKVRESVPALREDFNFSKEDRLLVMVAGFRPQKDQDTLIKALAYLPLNYKLLLIGDGERRGVLEQIVKDMDLVDRVSFLGIRNDVYSLIKMCDIAILSSHWEGFGLVAIEALACGVPLIVSNVAGLSEVVGDHAVKFTSGDVHELVSSILYCSGLEREKLEILVGENQFYCEKFSLEAYVLKLEEIYKKIVN